MNTDPQSPIPRYSQIKRMISARIQSGDWRPGDRIASEAELVRDIGVSRMTINRALRELTLEGQLVRVQGVGTFVAENKAQSALFEVKNIADEIQARGGRHEAKVILLRREAASDQTARLLEINSGDEVYHSLLLHLENDIAVQIEDRLVVPRMAKDYLQQDFTRITPFVYLTEVAPISEAEHVIEAALPAHLPQRPAVTLRRARIARVLGITIDDAEIERVLTALGMQVQAQSGGWRIAQHADQPGLGFALQPADDAGFVAFAMPFQPRQEPVALSRRAAFLGRNEINGGRGFIAVPGQRPDQGFAVRVQTGDFDDADFRQFAAFDEALFLAALDGAFGFELFENALELDAVRALETQLACEIALVGAGTFGQQFEHARLIQGGRVLRFIVFLQLSYSPASSGTLGLP